MSVVPINPSGTRFEIHSKGLSFFLCAKHETLSFIREDVKTCYYCTSYYVRTCKWSINQKFSEGDFVYLSGDRPSPAKKLKHMFTGPYVISNVCSPHTVVLPNPNTNTLPSHIHIDRLKLAHIHQQIISQ